MQITVVFEDEVAVLEVGEEMELENFVALVRLEIPSIETISNDQFVLMHGIRRIPLAADTLKMTLHHHGVQNQDVLNVLSPDRRRDSVSTRSRVQSIGTQQQSAMREMIAGLVSQIKVPGKKAEGAGGNAADREAEMRKFTRRLFDELTAEPGRIRQYKLTMPQVAEAFESKPDDYDNFHRVFSENGKEQMRRAALAHDENSIEGQAYIARKIQEEAIRQQYEFAQEHFPESYIPINLLHIRVKINGVEVLAMVDSGAQNSIISAQMAKKCNIYDFVDERFHIMARGIGGSSKVRGRIHVCKMQIGDAHLSCPLDVLDDNRVEALLGLTFLRPNGCIIDCSRNVLIMGGTETPFLGEQEFEREVKRLGQAGMGMSSDSDEDEGKKKGKVDEKMEE